MGWVYLFVAVGCEIVWETIGHAIFVTDDKKASSAFLNPKQQAFLGINLWTSVDVILYIGAVLLKDRKTGFDDIKATLRDVYAGAKNGAMQMRLTALIPLYASEKRA